MLAHEPPTIDELASKRWRLEHLYLIVDRDGCEQTFKLNRTQKHLLNGMWHQMLVLKARQLGCTTFFALTFLDDCIFNENISAGILADKKESAEEIFKRKIKFAFDRLPAWVKPLAQARHDRVGELVFENGSSFRVSTGFRSGTYQRLLVSEFGRICARSPDVSREIVTGSLNAVSRDQIVVIESTAEGREGYFYDFSVEAERLAKEKTALSPMQMRFFFFPWYTEPSYRAVADPSLLTPELKTYMHKIERETSFKIDQEQMCWYAMKQKILQDSMKSEYPSTPREAFESASEGLYYGQQIDKARADGRICDVWYDEYKPVYTAWDLGLDDYTAIWCVQLTRSGQINVINFYENRDEAPRHYAEWINAQGYHTSAHIMPHDARSRDAASMISYETVISPLLKGDILVLSVAECSKLAGIQLVRAILGRCCFDKEKTAAGVKRLESYKKQWNSTLGCYREDAVHDESSHAADAFRYLAVGLGKIDETPKSIESDLKALRAYWGG